MNIQYITKYLKTSYNHSVRDSLSQRRDDLVEEVKKWKLRVKELMDILNNLELFINSNDPNELTEFCEGERDLRYNELVQAEAKLAQAERKLADTQKLINRAERAHRLWEIYC
jgi:uncharacterized protein (DUF342 family)